MGRLWGLCRRGMVVRIVHRRNRDESVVAVGVLLASGAVVGVMTGASELTWPFFTVSDVLATSGGYIVYGSWVASLALWVAVHGTTDVFAKCGTVAVCAPLFPIPYGTPLVWQHVFMAPIACMLHFAWAVAFVSCAFVGLAQARGPIASLTAVFAGMFFGGQWIGSPWMVAGGCVVEWALLFVPALHLSRPSPIML